MSAMQSIGRITPVDSLAPNAIAITVTDSLVYILFLCIFAAEKLIKSYGYEESNITRQSEHGKAKL